MKINKKLLKILILMVTTTTSCSVIGNFTNTCATNINKISTESCTKNNFSKINKNSTNSSFKPEDRLFTKLKDFKQNFEEKNEGFVNKISQTVQSNQQDFEKNKSFKSVPEIQNDFNEKNKKNDKTSVKTISTDHNLIKPTKQLIDDIKKQIDSSLSKVDEEFKKYLSETKGDGSFIIQIKDLLSLILLVTENNLFPKIPQPLAIELYNESVVSDYNNPNLNYADFALLVNKLKDLLGPHGHFKNLEDLKVFLQNFVQDIKNFMTSNQNQYPIFQKMVKLYKYLELMTDLTSKDCSFTTFLQIFAPITELKNNANENKAVKSAVHAYMVYLIKRIDAYTGHYINIYTELVTKTLAPKLASLLFDYIVKIINSAVDKNGLKKVLNDFCNTMLETTWNIQDNNELEKEISAMFVGINKFLNTNSKNKTLENMETLTVKPVQQNLINIDGPAKKDEVDEIKIDEKFNYIIKNHQLELFFDVTEYDKKDKKKHEWLLDPKKGSEISLAASELCTKINNLISIIKKLGNPKTNSISNYSLQDMINLLQKHICNERDKRNVSFASINKLIAYVKGLKNKLEQAINENKVGNLIKIEKTSNGNEIYIMNFAKELKEKCFELLKTFEIFQEKVIDDLAVKFIDSFKDKFSISKKILNDIKKEIKTTFENYGINNVEMNFDTFKALLKKLLSILEKQPNSFDDVK